MSERIAAKPSPADPALRIGQAPVAAVHPSLDVVGDRLRIPVTAAEQGVVELVHANRPAALRAYDQIAMRPTDLLNQAKLIAPYLAGTSVAFVGDADGASLLLGMLGMLGAPGPAAMLVLDFDERLLSAARTFADRHGFGERMRVRRYNVFDPRPGDLVGHYDWFYINPPYGSRTAGASARLFMARGCELTRPTAAAGCAILPDDVGRPWSRRGMYATQRWLLAHGWRVRTKIDGLHRYLLDDDPELTSSLMLVERATGAGRPARPMAYAGRRVEPMEIPHFYGRSVTPPYPRYVRADGSVDFDWRTGEGVLGR